MSLRKIVTTALLAAASVSALPARRAEAGPLLDWLFHPKTAQPAIPVGPPYTVSGYAPYATPYSAGYAAALPYTAGYVPYSTAYAPYTTGYSQASAAYATGYTPYGVAYRKQLSDTVAIRHCRL